MNIVKGRREVLALVSRMTSRFVVRCACLAALGAATVGLVGVVWSSAAAASTTSRPSVRAEARLLARSVLQEVNLQRAHYGLSAAHLITGYTPQVTAAAVNNVDPALNVFGPGAVEEYGLWGIAPATSASSAAPNPGAVVDNWVENDGWQGANTENLDCTSPTAPGCNGHRRAVLSSPPHAGDKLGVDVVTYPTSWQGAPAISVAMIMVWVAPTQATGPVS